MASILFGTAITDARGSQGGTVFSRNRNGAYTRIKTQPVNPNTIPQQNRRSQFAATAASWRALSSAEQQSWVTAAPSYPYTNRVGVVSTYTGFQLFTKVNNQLRSVDAPPLVVEISPVALDGIYIRDAVYAVGAGSLIITLQFGDDVNPVVPVNAVLVVQGTSPLSLGVNSPKAKNFRTIANVTGGTNTSAQSFADQYNDIFGSPPVDTVNTFIQIFFVDITTGQVSPKIFVKVTFVP